MDYRALRSVTIVTISIVVLLPSSIQTLISSYPLNDIHGNLLNNNDARYSSSACCIIPTCATPSRCYEMISCGYMCSSGKYPPADQVTTPGYRLKNNYTKYACRFGDCKFYQFTCGHCQDPREPEFSIYLIRGDCKDCYSKPPTA